MPQYGVLIFVFIFNEMEVLNTLEILMETVANFKNVGTSDQGGGIGRHTVPPPTTRRSTKTNLKTKNNQNWQKIELYRSLTSKQLKKKHSPRPVGGVEMGSREERTCSKAAPGGAGGPTFG